MLAALLTCALLLPAAPLAPAAQDPPGQSMSDLRQEIERLAAESARKDEELARANARIKELERTIATLRSLPGGAPAKASAPDTPAAPAPAPDPADPSIGPGGLLAKYQAEYLQQYPELPDLNSDLRRSEHLRSLDRWSDRVSRTPVGRVTWTGSIDPSTVSVGQREVTFTAEFKASGRTMRVPVAVERVVFERFTRAGGLPPGPTALTGEPRAQFTVNPDRADPGAFDFPPMVAPYVECRIAFAAKALAEPPADSPVPPAPTAP